MVDSEASPDRMVSFPRLTLLPGRAPLLWWVPLLSENQVRGLPKPLSLYVHVNHDLVSSINTDFAFRYGHYSYGALVNHSLKGY
jgi:hypothetical protein